MPPSDNQTKFNLLIHDSLQNESFIKMSLGNYKGTEEALKQLLIRKIFIKQEEKLAITYRYKTRDIVKNLDRKEALELVTQHLKSGFKVATLFTDANDFIFEELPNGKQVMRTQTASAKQTESVSHDKQKSRLITPNEKPYLTALKITDEEGKVFKNAQDKFKQINHYIEILSSLIKELPPESIKKVADMGSGKGYLTFALYDYLHSVLKLDTQVVGVEFRSDMVQLCNNIAHQSTFDSLQFVEGSIEQYDAHDVNILIALHACDTATDDAIFKGIQANAQLIVVAPCCHKQIRREIEKNKVNNDVSFLTQYGIFLERQAEMVTDGIRALILEYYGYKTKVFEFISDAHTPKNVLVVGIKTKQLSAERKAAILQKINDSKSFFGIGYHHLERLLNLNTAVGD
jgi:SAM-dependent methyltransferase